MYRLNFNILAFLFSILVVKLAVAADFQKGLDAALNRDFLTANEEWTPLAERGDATPQFQLGWLYEEGLGVSKDYKTAIKWYKRAAEQGYAYAQSALGRMYEKGKGVPQDYSRAYLWFNIASLLWDPDAKTGQERVTKKMNLDQIEYAKKLSIKCIQKNYKNC
jgi:TPR repeat protein